MTKLDTYARIQHGLASSGSKSPMDPPTTQQTSTFEITTCVCHVSNSSPCHTYCGVVSSSVKSLGIKFQLNEQLLSLLSAMTFLNRATGVKISGGSSTSVGRDMIINNTTSEKMDNLVTIH